MEVEGDSYSILQIGNPFFDLQSEFRESPLKFLNKLGQDRADILKFKAGFKTGYIINHPDLIQRILKDEYDKFPKLSSLPNVIYGKSYFGSSAQNIRTTAHQTKMMMATHRLRTIYPQVNQMVSLAIQNGIGNCPQRINVFQWLNEVMIDIIGETILGVPMKDIKQDLFEMFDTLLSEVHEKILKLISIPQFIPTPRNRKYKKLLSKLNYFLDTMIETHHKTLPDGSVTLISILSQKMNEGEMTRQQVRDAILTTIVAGYETTSNTIGFLLSYMAKIPKVNKNIRKELETITDPIDIDSFINLKYLQASISEVVRHLPSVWIMARTNPSETFFGNIKIDKNSLIVVSPYIEHHNTRYWEDPFEFNPERFLCGTDYGYSYIPFGAGPYRCIGRNFALMLIPMFIYYITKDYEFELLEDFEFDAHITIHAPTGIWMSFQEKLLKQKISV